MIELLPYHEFKPELSYINLFVEGSISKSEMDVLEVEFIMGGDVDQVILPKLKSTKERQNHLWEKTCFEVFFGIPDQPDYFEVNVSPSGAWNIFQFSNYRDGMRQVEDAKIDVSESALLMDEYRLRFKIPLKSMPEKYRTGIIEASLSAVIELPQNYKSYWSIHHVAAEPDFHQRKAFTQLLR